MSHPSTDPIDKERQKKRAQAQTVARSRRKTVACIRKRMQKPSINTVVSSDGKRPEDKAVSSALRPNYPRYSVGTVYRSIFSGQHGCWSK